VALRWSAGGARTQISGLRPATGDGSMDESTHRVARAGSARVGLGTTREEPVNMALSEIASREQWLAARRVLLTMEKEHTRAGDAIAVRRRTMPMVETTEP
jgi:Bacterial protein of unknown function (DUF899)